MCVQYIEGLLWCMLGIPWVHRGITWVHRGNIMNTLGDAHYIGVFNRNWKVFTHLLPHMHHDILPIYWVPPMYWTPPMYSWYPPMYWTPPDVLNTHYTGCLLLGSRFPVSYQSFSPIRKPLEMLSGPQKKYTSSKSHIFVLRTDKSLNCMPFVRQDLNINFET